ncbi:MAG: hypothetical protein LBT59_19890 [Clostridiales bacterium]|jgi:Flp pilus assembly pilin Flp|nr:hypothetical protein [Clostridiales bacterium]
MTKLSALLIAFAITAQGKAARFLKEENGDTNFLSIIILLAIAVIVAGVFIAFKDQIIGMVSDTFNNFKTVFDGQTTGV